jgi:hypothetical protein
MIETNRCLRPVVLQAAMRQAQGRQLPHAGRHYTEEEFGHHEGHGALVVGSMLPVQGSVEGALGATSSRLAPLVKWPQQQQQSPKNAWDIKTNTCNDFKRSRFLLFS